MCLSADARSEAITGWQGFIKVDGENYNWMGAHPGATLVEQTSLEITSTRSIFTVNAGGLVEMKIEFLSPVYTDDLRRQSITSSYLEVSVRSLDGNEHDVQLYADVSGGLFPHPFVRRYGSLIFQNGRLVIDQQ